MKCIFLIIVSFLTYSWSYGQVPDSLKALFSYKKNSSATIKIDSTYQVNGTTVNRLTYESPKGGRVPAYLVEPAKPGKYAALVFVHWGGGNKEEFLEEAQQLAAQGIVSFLPDAPWLMPHTPYTSLTHSAYEIVVHGTANLQRAADILESRANVDRARMAFVGHSYGAHLGGILSGIDPRFKTFVLMAGSYSLSQLISESTEPQVLQTKTADPEGFEKYITKLSSLDARHFIRYSPAPVFHQFARNDEAFSTEHAFKYIEVTPPLGIFKFYETTHAFDSKKAAQDRREWLLKKLTASANEKTRQDLMRIPTYEATQLPLVVTTSEASAAKVVRNIPYITNAENSSLQMDIYQPTAIKKTDKRPVVILLHGQTHPALLSFAKDWRMYADYGRLLAQEGIIAVTANVGSAAIGPEPGQLMARVERVAKNVDALVAYLTANADKFNIDPDKICLWSFSGAGNYGVGNALSKDKKQFRCLVAYYTFLDASDLTSVQPPLANDVMENLSALYQLKKKNGQIPPVFIVKAGLDRKDLNNSIDAFVKESDQLQAPVTQLELKDGFHGFDALNDYKESREIIRKTIHFIKENTR